MHHVVLCPSEMHSIPGSIQNDVTGVRRTMIFGHFTMCVKLLKCIKVHLMVIDIDL